MNIRPVTTPADLQAFMHLPYHSLSTQPGLGAAPAG